MSVSFHVVPLSTTLNMFGEPAVSSAYSLSGHVSISISSVKSLFEPRRHVRLILQSLIVTFEGQSELITARTGYVPFRICSISRELVSNDGDAIIELNNEGHEDSDKPCVWNVVFNIPIPGWLPASSKFGLDNSAGTRYTLYAEAKFLNPDLRSGGSASWLSMLCLPFCSATSQAEASTRIVINRYYEEVPSCPMSSFSTRFPIKSNSDGDGDSEDDRFPQMEIHLSLPRRVDTTQSSVPFVMRIRAVNMDESFRKRFQVNGFTMQFCQVETFRDAPSVEYANKYPIPPPSLQPPEQPLLTAHSLGALHDLGFLFGPIVPGVPSTRTFSLLPNMKSGRFTLENCHVFADAEDSLSEKYWYIMESTLPIFRDRGSLDDSHWAGPEKLRPTGISPLFDVQHEMLISISCAEETGNEKIGYKLQFRVPVRFVDVIPPPPPQSAAGAGARDNNTADSTPRSSIDSDSTPLFVDVAPCARNLPAYSQLFDSSGERLIDYTIPLPVYSPPSPSSSHTLSSPQVVDDLFDGKPCRFANDQVATGSNILS